MRIFIITIITIVMLALAGGNAFFYLERQRLDQKIAQEQSLAEKWEEEYNRVRAQKEKQDEANAGLRSDALKYLESNSKLKAEVEGLQKDLTDTVEIMKEKEARLQELEEQLQAEPKTVSSKEDGGDDNEEMIAQIDKLKGEMAQLEEKRQKERASFDYNLGVAYTKAGLFEEAVSAYESSLEKIDNNPEAHYNLGLLLKRGNKNPEKAVLHFQRYLELSPEAEDKDEVQEWVDGLKAMLFSL